MEKYIWICISFSRIILDKIQLGSYLSRIQIVLASFEYQISMWIDTSRTHVMVQLAFQLEGHVAVSYELKTISNGW